MSELQTIEAALKKAARRHRLSRALRGAFKGLFYASLLWLATLVTYKFLPLSWQVLALGAGLGAACVIVGGVIGAWRRMTPAETARWVDLQQNLKERLSTALEVAQSPVDAEWKSLVVSDAAQHARSLDARRLVPFHLPRLAGWCLLVLLLAASLGFIPEYRSKAHLQKQADAANIKDTGKNLAEVTRRALQTKPPALAQTAKAIEKVEEVGQQLEKVSLTRADALKQLSSAREKVAEQLKELDRNGALKPLERAQREQANSSGKQNPDALQKQIDALQKSLGNGAAQDPGKMDQFQQDLAKAQQMAANLPDKNSPEGKAAREQLSQMLSSLAQQMKDAGVPLDSLEDALKALQQGNVDQFLKEMNVAANDLEKLADTAKQLQALQQQQANQNAGKNLAEQLQQAQTDAAKQTLEKMIQQLKTGQMSPQELDKIMDEVAKAISPAGEYGKVADHLKQAVKQMQQAQKSGEGQGRQQAQSAAAQSLASAAQELEKMAQQMADAQQLAQTMEMLERAQQAIATGQGWGQCKGGGTCSYCKGAGCFICLKKGKGWKQGGGNNPSGVGTWADDDTGWTYYNENMGSPVDNSGIVRPDMDPRGMTERDATLNDSLKPTKVKGQMSPGGQMPSVTLKGVAIKGQSRVQFEEAATAAQTEAQSALNQDQVPRAYRGAVRDYFDDLKK
jgi:hypothetical protein